MNARYAIGAFVAMIVLGGWWTFGRAERWRAIDGDTIRSSIMDRSVRLIGIDTPERGSRARCDSERSLAEAARAYLQHRLDRAARVEVEIRETYPDGRRDPWGRLPGIVRVDGIDVAGDLVREGYARPYVGRRRQGWCS